MLILLEWLVMALAWAVRLAILVSVGIIVALIALVQVIVAAFHGSDSEDLDDQSYVSLRR